MIITGIEQIHEMTSYKDSLMLAVQFMAYWGVEQNIQNLNWTTVFDNIRLLFDGSVSFWAPGGESSGIVNH